MKRFKLHIYFKIFLVELFLMMVMTLLVPLLANYPPHSEEFAFQAQIEKVNHIMQYSIFTIVAFVIQYFVGLLIFKKTFKYVKKFPDVSKEQTIKVRKELFQVNRNLLITQVVILVILFISLNAMVNITYLLEIKFSLTYFSLFFAAWVLETSLIKDDINDIIKSTYEINPEITLPKKQTHFYSTLLYDTVPLFVVILIVMSLLGYGLVQDKVGENSFDYYKVKFSTLKLSNKPKAEVEKQLSNIEKNNSSDYYFILSEDGDIFSTTKGYATDFFKVYAKNFLEQNNGRLYEYYGIEEQAYGEKIKLENGKEALVGFKFHTVTYRTIIEYIIADFTALLVYMFIMYVWSKNVSKNLSEVANKLSDISQEKNVDLNNVIPVYSNDEIALLARSYSQIQEKIKSDIDEISDSQDRLMERERLATLGQMIGGIAHNMKTPIMSIAGATDGLDDLITEYRESVGDSDVTVDDHHQIADDMESWVKKIKSYNSYMSDIITTVKGQAVNMSQDPNETFTIKELLNSVDVLMKHELKANTINFNVDNKVPEDAKIHGNVNSLVQVVNNLIQNSIQSYPAINDEMLNQSIEKLSDRSINLNIELDNDNIIIKVQDFGSGIPKKVQDKLFKEMITTKGHKGSGLGIFMSYSTIKGNFKGNMTFVSEEGKGTIFTIKIPIN